MARPEWKGPNGCEKSIKLLKNAKKTYNIPIVARDTEVLPKFLNLIVKVYNGKKYNEFTVNEDMLGHKFGEFSITRARFSFKKKKSKK